MVYKCVEIDVLVGKVDLFALTLGHRPMKLPGDAVIPCNFDFD